MDMFNRESLITAILLSLFLIPVFCNTVAGDVIPEQRENHSGIKTYFERYFNRNETTQPYSQKSCPGWIVGNWRNRPEKLFCKRWAYRKFTYEIFFSSRSELARMIYGLALFTRDINETVSLERFEKGVQGFHYSTEQVLEWSNSVLKKDKPIYTKEEEGFLSKLVEDNVLSKSEGKHIATGNITHILGAASGKKRSLSLNLNHERIHIMWDEDVEFKELQLRKWENLSDSQKSDIYKKYKNRGLTDEIQIIEEWAVKQNETHPIEELTMKGGDYQN